MNDQMESRPDIPMVATEKGAFPSVFYERVKLRNPETGEEKWYRRCDDTVDFTAPMGISVADARTVVAQIDAFADVLADTKHYESLPALARGESIRLAHVLGALRKTMIQLIVADAK